MTGEMISESVAWAMIQDGHIADRLREARVSKHTELDLFPSPKVRRYFKQAGMTDFSDLRRYTRADLMKYAPNNDNLWFEVLPKWLGLFGITLRSGDPGKPKIDFYKQLSLPWYVDKNNQLDPRIGEQTIDILALPVMIENVLNRKYQAPDNRCGVATIQDLFDSGRSYVEGTGIGVESLWQIDQRLKRLGLELPEHPADIDVII